MLYAVRAIRRMESISLRVEATDPAHARLQVESEGASVVSIKAFAGIAGFRLGRGSAFPLLQFNQSLLILLRAGLSIVEAIEALAERETRTETRAVLRGVHGQLQTGVSFSAALASRPGVFPPLYVASVRANEKTGALPEAIERFIVYRAQSDQLRQRIVSASIYPALILGVGGLVIAFLLFYVVPRFSLVFQDMGDRIPAMSRWLLDWGRFAQGNAATLLLGGALLAALAVWAAGRPAVRIAAIRLLERLPRIHHFLRVYQLARFYRSLGMLQRAGIPIVTALDMVADVLPESLRERHAAARREIVEGRSISQALETHGLTTPVSLRLLRVAERSGQMGELLERAAAFHDDEVSQAIDWFVRLFEPLLMVAIGLVIGVVVLLMYAPIFELAGSLQ